MYHKQAIENSPLQAYASALMFSPANSLIKRLFKYEEPKWIMIKSPIKDEWSACLQTLEGHGRPVFSVAFSHDSIHLASASSDCTVKIWDVSSGDCLQMLKDHSDQVHSVAFSHNSICLASASVDHTVKMWDVSSGACLQTLEGHSNLVSSVAFSHNSTCLASASYDHAPPTSPGELCPALPTPHRGRQHPRHCSARQTPYCDDHRLTYSTRLNPAGGRRRIHCWGGGRGIGV